MPDSRHSSAPADMLSNALEESNTAKRPNYENEASKSGSSGSTTPNKSEPVVDGHSGRSRGKLGRSGKNVTTVGGTANEEEKDVRSKSKNLRRRDSKWEVLTNLESGPQYTIRPKKSEGYLAKRRRWPLKGWHKR